MSRYPKLLESCVHESKLDEIISCVNAQDVIPRRNTTPEEDAETKRLLKERNLTPAFHPGTPTITSVIHYDDNDSRYSLELCLELKPNQKIKRRHVVGAYWSAIPFFLGLRTRDELFELKNFEKFPPDYIPHWKKAGFWPAFQ